MLLAHLHPSQLADPSPGLPPGSRHGAACWTINPNLSLVIVGGLCLDIQARLLLPDMHTLAAEPPPHTHSQHPYPLASATHNNNRNPSPQQVLYTCPVYSQEHISASPHSSTRLCTLRAPASLMSTGTAHT